MTGVPIDEAGMRRATAAVHDEQGGAFPIKGAPGDCIHCDVITRRAVSAYLEAVGADVESRRRMNSRGAPGPLESRLCTPWRPFTDTEEER